MAVQTWLVNTGAILSLYLYHLSSQLAADSLDFGLPAEIQATLSYLVCLSKVQVEAGWCSFISGSHSLLSNRGTTIACSCC